MSAGTIAIPDAIEARSFTLPDVKGAARRLKRKLPPRPEGWTYIWLFLATWAATNLVLDGPRISGVMILVGDLLMAWWNYRYVQRDQRLTPPAYRLQVTGTALIWGSLILLIGGL